MQCDATPKTLQIGVGVTNNNFHGISNRCIALPILFLYKLNVLSKFKAKNKNEITEKREDASFCEMAFFFKFMMLFFAFAVGTQIMFQSNIFAFRILVKIS